ncbi:hypothetical protein I302_100078 [Kwoniella bestiolae CBS 10118]|uniref:Uncharacterized protein n=1 Tax=Kwoniella bestiolae CBS 10118 TaxID=1296100 RepID=A0A1B9G3Z8_9TREE|nr:hypothetical protein I302_03450 [Kwoniella bestiolae CBS 10118]OCF25777.1 hypothetical protein I302_03450 [Kwoniella bestiolae CBS 10118]
MSVSSSSIGPSGENHLTCDGPLPLPSEITSRIFTILTTICPTKIIRLSRHHYNDLIPTVYRDITLTLKNVERITYGMRGQCLTQDGEESWTWTGRKYEACSCVRSITFNDSVSVSIVEHAKPAAFSAASSLGNPTENIERDTTRKPIIFPDLQRVTFKHSFFFDESNMYKITERTESLPQAIPQSTSVYIDLSPPTSITTIHPSKHQHIFSLIPPALRPSTITIQLHERIFPISPTPLHRIPNVRVYINVDDRFEDMDEDRKREIYLKFKQFEWRIMTFRREPRERPVKVYVKDQKLIDYLVGRGTGIPQEENKYMRLYRWTEGVNWLD